MKYKIAVLVLTGLTLLLGYAWLNTKYQLHKIQSQAKVIGKSDTIYVTKKEFKYTPKYNTELIPRYVFFYGQNWKDSTVIEKKDTIHKRDSLVQILLSKQDLSLSFFNTEVGSFLKKDFKIDLDKYKYNWVNGQLTQKKVSKLKLVPYTYVQFRPFHKLTDIGLGLSLKTHNLQYKLGFNGYYYPCLNDKFGTDLEFSITYNLE